VSPVPLRPARGEDEARAPQQACPNCGTWVSDAYCPRCGQRNVERLVSTRRLVTEVLDDQLSLHAALPRTLRLLLLRPGELTRDYLAGRIARYLPPFKLYLGASLVFFLVLSSVAGFESVWRRIAPVAGAAAADSARGSIEVVNSGVDTTRVPAWSAPLARRFARQEAKINALGPREGSRLLYDATMRDVPVVLFLMVPAFAALLKLLYRSRYYVEHFVFVLHLHSLAFLVGAVVLLGGPPRLAPFGLMYLAAYLLLAMRRVYGEGWVRFGAKYLALLAGYVLSIGLLVTGVMFVAILTA